MPTIMIPAKLWTRLGLRGSPLAATDDERGRLGNWSLASVGTGVGELALFVNQRTCLTVLTPIAPLPILIRSFVLRLAEELGRHAIGRAMIQAELAALAEPKLGKNTDRSLLGTVNDLVFHAQVRAEKARTIAAACDTVQSGLNATPHVNRKPSFSDEALAALFATRH
jgi:hypothetical protein